MVGAGGLVVSIIAFAAGAILKWALKNPTQHGVNLSTVGEILMVVGVVGAVLAIIIMIAANIRRRRTVIDDGRGNVSRRVDSEY
jgi:beta-lactamase regulating signal transducer with metallopeptidase domain